MGSRAAEGWEGGEGWRGRKGRARGRQGETPRGGVVGERGAGAEPGAGAAGRGRSAPLKHSSRNVPTVCSWVPEQNPEALGVRGDAGTGSGRLPAPRGLCARPARRLGRRGLGRPERQGPRSGSRESGVPAGSARCASRLPPLSPALPLRARSPRPPPLAPHFWGRDGAVPESLGGRRKGRGPARGGAHGAGAPWVPPQAACPPPRLPQPGPSPAGRGSRAARAGVRGGRPAGGLPTAGRGAGPRLLGGLGSPGSHVSLSPLSSHLPPPLQTPLAPARSAALIRNSRSGNWSASFSSTCTSTKRSGCSCRGC